jgi:hypothetical protein
MVPGLDVGFSNAYSTLYHYYGYVLAHVKKVGVCELQY